MAGSLHVFSDRRLTMKRVDLSLPEFGFVVATRAALGAGIGLLATGRVCRRSRQRLGAALFALGALTTIPAAFLLFGRHAGPEGQQTAAA